MDASSGIKNKGCHPASDGADESVQPGGTGPARAPPLQLTDDDIDNLQLSEECRRMAISDPGSLVPPFPPLPLPVCAPHQFGSEIYSSSPPVDVKNSIPSLRSPIAIQPKPVTSTEHHRLNSSSDPKYDPLTPSLSPPFIPPSEMEESNTANPTADVTSPKSNDLEPKWDHFAVDTNKQSDDSSIELIPSPDVSSKAAARAPPVVLDDDLRGVNGDGGGGDSSPELLNGGDGTESSFEVVAPVRLRLWQGEERLRTEAVAGGTVHLTTCRLFRVYYDQPHRQLAVPFHRIDRLRYDRSDTRLEVVCVDNSTFTP
ncbi:proline-rich receptor-like protein kinase PERK9 [Amphibalanus amphitrite]|uniref:proline-rich receptor-like protein kinase PERK9 n=1 Tax=Amphibalanus amphitrite TaxID=1232801 RepID=UPI001C918169|nr:proline-rich receptor-like protein kinase PERK9 [Amphibalanus amphitrite]